MAKKKKPGYDFKKEWPRIREELVHVSHEALTLAKKGEKEVRRFSQKGKWQFDATALKLKQNHLYGKIGEEYLKAKCPAQPTPQLKKLVDEWDKIDREIKSINKKIRTFNKMTSRKK